MEKNGLGKRINAVRKDRGLTADRLSEMCTFFRICSVEYYHQFIFVGLLSHGTIARSKEMEDLFKSRSFLCIVCLQ